MFQEWIKSQNYYVYNAMKRKGGIILTGKQTTSETFEELETAELFLNQQGRS